jgi:tRNA-specific 2-thiouridylase
VQGERLIVDLGEPIRGLARGQAVVLYDGTRVLGSATVDATSRDPSSVDSSPRDFANSAVSGLE